MTDPIITVAAGLAYEEAWLKTPEGAPVVELRAQLDRDVKWAAAAAALVETLLGVMGAASLDRCASHFDVHVGPLESAESLRRRILSKIMFGSEEYPS